MTTFHAKLPRTNTSSGRSLHAQAQNGMSGVMDNLNRFVKWVSEDVAPEVMLDAIDPTMDLSDHYAPKDSRTMVNSRYSKVTKRGGVPRVEIGYNEHGEAPYTIFVHEMPQYHHEAPTRYKFLQSALDEDTPEIIGRIAQGLRRRVGT